MAKKRLSFTNVRGKKAILSPDRVTKLLYLLFVGCSSMTSKRSSKYNLCYIGKAQHWGPLHYCSERTASRGRRVPGKGTRTSPTSAMRGMETEACTPPSPSYSLTSFSCTWMVSPNWTRTKCLLLFLNFEVFKSYILAHFMYQQN